MTLSSKDCTQYIADWVSKNHDLMPIEAEKLEWRASGFTHIQDGTKPSHWKRRAKQAMSDGSVIRAYDCNCSIFVFGTMMVLFEQDGKITKLEQCPRRDLETTYGLKYKWM